MIWAILSTFFALCSIGAALYIRHMQRRLKIYVLMRNDYPVAATWNPRTAREYVAEHHKPDEFRHVRSYAFEPLP